MRLSEQTLGALLVTGSAVAWSTTGLFTTVLTLDAATMLVWRGAFGALGLLAALALFEGRAGFARFASLGAAGWAYAAVSGVGMLCFIAALRTTSVAHVAIIYAVAPFLAAALGWAMLGERPGGAAIAASGVAFCGALVMVGLGGDGALLGDLLALAMTLALALMMVIARRHPGIPTLPAAALSSALSALASLPFAASLAVSADEVVVLAGFGLVNSALGLTLFLLGSARIPPVQTALIGALDAPLAPLWVWVFFAQVPSNATLAGGMIVFLAVAWHFGHRPAAQAARGDSAAS